MSLTRLVSDDLIVDVDPRYGGDVTRIADQRRRDFLLRTPWEPRASAILAGAERATSTDPVSGWIERYRGGWQAICPNPGAPRELNGTTIGFHGSTTGASWVETECRPDALELATELFDVPLRIERRISLSGTRVTWADRLTNQSPVPIDLDYATHPAFGGVLLAEGCRVAVPADRLVLVDADARTGRAAGGIIDDLAAPEALRVPGPGQPTRRFGWLEGLDAGDLTVVGGGMTARLTWDPAILPYVWWWEECGASAGFPWFGRGRVLALEPCSVTPVGERSPGIRLEPFGVLDIAVTLKLEENP